MHLPTLISILAPLASLASATALTYKLAAHEKACFFTDVQTKGSKIAFYFAVCLSFLYSDLLPGETDEPRYNQAAPSMSITQRSVPMNERLWKAQKNDKATMSSRRMT
jgi:hypothetical protein